MAQTCTRCSRVNPSDAIYCYYDGVALGGGRHGGPVAVAAQAFANPFVFPTGRSCRSFAELARACQEEWGTARELMEKGYLETFFGGLGRLDLASAAREAAKFPDRDRGLDQLLGKLPGDVLAEPRLRVDPATVNLGVLEVGRDLEFELHLENQGERLLYGSVTCEGGIWLALGEAGGSEKHFQFTHELTIPVKVRGDRLQARPRPIEARLAVESNGGRHTVVVRAEVPVKPFPSGALAGAKTPRELAQKCQANPRETAPLFESGEVERWYVANGWTYPVQIPAASGLAALQQFFEALGMTKPPRVEISTQEINLEGAPGERLTASVEVSTPDKKFVYAHGTSDAPWLEVSRAKFNGRTASIGMSIPSVPNKPGSTLSTRLTVHANGNQRFVLPVNLTVTGAAKVFDFESADEAAAPVVAEPAEEELAFTAAPAKKSSPELRKAPVEDEDRPRRRQTGGGSFVSHAIPAVLLVMALLGVVTYDLLRLALGGGDRAEGGPSAGQGWNYDIKKLRSPEPRIGVAYRADNRFGVVMLDANEPGNKEKHKRLTASPQGDTNNTVVRIAGYDYIYGFTTPSNTWYGRKWTDVEAPRRGRISQMDFGQEQVRVTQHVEIVPSDTGLLDTCLVYYAVRNYGTVPQKVGLRVMLDTYIGDNDGVPFLIPGRSGLVTTKEDFEGDKIPDYIEAVERPNDPKDPGTTVRLALKGLRLPGIKLEEPQKLRICQFPGANAKWDWDPADMGDDSAVAIYWPVEDMKPKTVRHMAFTYGLGKLDVGDMLALTAPPAVIPNREFVVTAYVWDAKKGQKVTLELPEGVTFASGESPEKTVEEGGARAQVFWRVKATRAGDFKLEATSGRARSQPRTIEVRAAGLFG